MRKFFLLMTFFALIAASALAGQTTRVELLNGVYSVIAPNNWHVEEADNGAFVAFSPTGGSPMSVLFTAPNPTVEGEIAEYAGVIMGVLFNSLGGGQVTYEEETDLDGHPAIMFHFTIADELAGGLAIVCDIEGYAVLTIALAPTEDLEEFLETAVPIMASLEIDLDEAEDNRDLLESLAESLLEELVKELTN